jgi:hypothetical protein
MRPISGISEDALEGQRISWPSWPATARPSGNSGRRIMFFYMMAKCGFGSHLALG